MSRTINFSAGPAALPLEVLEKAKAELLDFRSSGMSVMEMSHRSAVFLEVLKEAESNLRFLLGISDDYHVLFLQGGATAQFSALPMNLAASIPRADYLDTGSWSRKAIKEGAKFCDVNVVASSEQGGYTRIPDLADWNIRKDTAFLHLCSNETIGGVQFKSFPSLEIPLVADMSSDILSRKIEINKFGVIYAGAQKNIGPAGLAIVIVRKDLCGQAKNETPSFLDYSAQAESESMLNTPPTFTIYLAGLVFSWLLDKGGISVIEKENEEKASALYQVIDSGGFYSCPVEPEFRSNMNVPFRISAEELEKIFLDKAEQNGMFNLKGHRSVGGMRASIYNAVPVSWVEELVAFMNDFENEYG